MKTNIYYISREKNGFTLLESIVVISIIFVMAAIAIPSYSRMLPDIRLRSAAQDIYASLQAARMDAVKNNNSATDNTASDVIFNSGNGTYTKVNGTIVDLSEEYKGSVEYGAPTGSSVTFVPVAPIGEPRAIFNARGMAINQGAIYLKNTKDKYLMVNVLSSGVVEIKTP